MNTDFITKDMEEELGIANFPSTVKMKVLTTLAENILVRSYIGYMNSLPEEEAKKLAKAIEDGDTSIITFIAEESEEKARIFAEATRSVINEYKGVGENK